MVIVCTELTPNMFNVLFSISNIICIEGGGGGENYSLRFYLSLCHPAIVVLTATTKARVHG